MQEPLPRVLVTRRVESDGARYFGPYTDVQGMRRTLEVIQRVFQVRSCRYDLPREAPDRPCLDHHIGRCRAPCVGRQAIASYRADLEEVVACLDGKTEAVEQRIAARMTTAAAEMDYERAAEYRDALTRLGQLREPTVVLSVEGGDRDVIGYARDGEEAAVAWLRIRDGKLVAREHRYLTGVEDAADGDVLAQYLTAYYRAAPARAREVLLPFDFEDRALVAESLEPGTRFVVPQRGPKRELVDLAEQNARHLLEELKLTAEDADERAVDPVYELGRVLGLAKLPRSLVCVDNSTAQGKDSVGSVVWFEN